MVVADDYHLEAGGEHHRFALFASFLLRCTCGVPLSWDKTAGGETVVWVGFELLHITLHLGISQRRAELFTKWAREVADSDQVHVARFEGGLGRIMFVVGALELERLFLGPPHRFMSLHPQSSVRRVPPYVSFFLRYLADRISDSRHHNCAVSMESTTVAPRVDAQASSERTGIGRLVPGKRTRRQDRCQRVAITRAQGRRLALDLFPVSKTSAGHLDSGGPRCVGGTETTVRRDPREKHTSVQIVPTITDNRGNGALLNKLMSTKFTASAVLVELASYVRKMNEPADCCRMGASRGKQGGRHAREWQRRRL